MMKDEHDSSDNSKLVKDLDKHNDCIMSVKNTPSAEVVGFDGLAVMLDSSVDKIRNMDRSGQLPKPQKVGRTKKWLIVEIRAWLKAEAPGRSKWEVIKNNIQF